MLFNSSRTWSFRACFQECYLRRQEKKIIMGSLLWGAGLSDSSPEQSLRTSLTLSESSRWLLWDIITCWKLNMCLNMCFCRTKPLWVTSVLPHTLQIEINLLQTTASSLDGYMGWSNPSDCSMNKHVQNVRTLSCTQFPFRDFSSLQSKSNFVFIIAAPLVKCIEIWNHKEEQEF